MRTAIVSKKTKAVTNVIELSPDAKFNPGDKFTVIPSETAEIGDRYADGVFERK